MSDYSFKNLSDVDLVEEPADGTTVMGFEDGKPIQMPMSEVRTKSSGVFVIDPSASDYSLTDTAYGDKLRDALLNGKAVWFFLNSSYYASILAFDATYRTNGQLKLTVYPAINPNTEGLQANSNLAYKLQFSITG